MEIEVLPVVLEYGVNFGTEDNSPNFIWDEETGTYSLTFTVIKTLSNGEIEDEFVQLDKLIPNGTIEYTSDDVQDEHYFGELVSIFIVQVPAPPVTEETEAIITSIEIYDIDLIAQGQNQFKVVASYIIHYSNGHSKVVENEILPGGNITNPTTQNNNPQTREYTIKGFKYNITAHYDAENNKFFATYTLK